MTYPTLIYQEKGQALQVKCSGVEHFQVLLGNISSFCDITQSGQLLPKMNNPPSCLVPNQSCY